MPSGAVTGGAADVKEVCSRRRNEVIGRACTAAVEAVVEGGEVLAAALCSPSTFMLKVSIRGSSPHTEGVCVVCDPQAMLYHPGDRRRGPVKVRGVTLGGV